jgi:hypothetical protein
VGVGVSLGGADDARDESDGVVIAAVRVPAEVRRRWLTGPVGDGEQETFSYNGFLILPNGVAPFLHFAEGNLANQEPVCTRLVGLEASVVSDQRKPDGTGWVTLADPEGNQFCAERGVAERVSKVGVGWESGVGRGGRVFAHVTSRRRSTTAVAAASAIKYPATTRVA